MKPFCKMKNILLWLLLCFASLGFCQFLILCVASKEAEAASSPTETGVCGPSAVWKWEKGVLTISGSGAITKAPWTEYLSDIEEIVVGDEITEIGNGSFSGIDP